MTSKESLSYAKNTKPSVIVAVKNEDQCLHANLSSLLSQSFCKEVIVMDDFSTDATPKILSDLSDMHPNLKVNRPSLNLPGKKLALQEGIQMAQSPYLILTDGDCQPASNNWAQIMVGKIDKGQELVLGYGPLIKDNTSVNGFARFETLITAVQYFGFALFNSPYMGVGRNMAFSKSLFNQVNGYEAHKDLPSGDDDLFVQSIKNKTRAAISLNPDSFCFSKGPSSWKDFIRQKSRHVATSNRYTLKHKLLLSWHPFFFLLSAVLGLYLIALGHWKMVLIGFALRWFLIMVLGYVPFKKLDCKDLIPLVPLLDLALIPYYLFFSLGAFKGSPQKATWE